MAQASALRWWGIRDPADLRSTDGGLTHSSHQAASGRGDEVHRVLDVVWRMESPRLVAALTRIVRDVGLAEDLAQDALEAALRQWPETGIPDNPAAWLMGTAKHRAIDALRRRATLPRKAAELGRDLATG